jgi:3-methyladenine DNA glycosylase AlkC
VPKTQDNPNAFKHFINADVVERIAESISAVAKEFPKAKFKNVIKELPALELKARVLLISQRLHQHLPPHFPQAVNVLLSSLKENRLKGFDLWPYTHYVQTHGTENVEASLDALRTMTQLFTSEFAVRPFLRLQTEKSLNYLIDCATNENVHVRRWSSEGSRPRLPWGERLDIFIQQPQLTLPILELLKYDEELYVRKSVANHLNDIAKDNPQVVLKRLAQWNKHCPKQHQDKISWITAQALRTLIKNGEPAALKLVGVSNTAQIKVVPLKLEKKSIKIGEHLNFSFSIHSQSKKTQKLIIDYVIHHQKAGGKTSPKVFKLKKCELLPGQSLVIGKKHSLKPVTTRKYYLGKHRVEIQINGKIYAGEDWVLR